MLGPLGGAGEACAVLPLPWRPWVKLSAPEGVSRMLTGVMWKGSEG